MYHYGLGDETGEGRSCVGISYSSTAGKAEIPRMKLVNGREFKLFFIADNKNRANGKANRCRKHGFHTRVVEVYSDVYAVYRRSKRDG
jgi:hypothetical protein